jgi:hypothetical protein
MRGWSSSHWRVDQLVWLDRLSVITTIVPVGLAASTKWRNRWSCRLLREGAVMVIVWPSTGRRPPYTQVFLRAAAVLQQRLDPVAVGGPGGRGQERARDHRAQLISADHRRRLGRGGVKDDDLRSFGAKSGSVLVVQERVRRQRMPSASRIRRTWLRPTWMP